MLSDDELKEILLEFVPESREHVQQFEAALLILEREPGHVQAVQDAFRAVHSLKGNSSFLGLEPLEALAHAAETVLAKIRAASLRADTEVVDSLLGLVDTLADLIDRVEREGHLREVEIGEKLASLAVWLGAQPSQAPSVIEELGARRALGDNKIRVDVALLDRMMNLVGELVLARNQLVQRIDDADSAAFAGAAQRLDLVTTQLQEVAMKTRMQPIGTLWSRFPRVVRDLALELGKQARLVSEGRDTELDKRILEDLADPLTHLIRNAIDHGVESPEQRRALGKDPEATLTLRAFHEGGMVHLELRDDGAGIDVERVRVRALEAGLVDERELAELDRARLLELLFVPGFSTRGEVTKLSGRGVGLDVVKANVEALGGTVSLTSELGRGTSIRLEIPLTLAIIPALLIRCGSERFAIPQVNLIEVVRVGPEQTGANIESVQGLHLLRLRGRLLPIAALAVELGLDLAPRLDVDAKVVVLQADQRQFGLLVDEVHETEEIVVKPLWRWLEGIPHYSGAAVLGDGRVSLILDAQGLAQRVPSLGTSVESRAAARTPATPVVPESPQELEELVLVCRNGHDGRLALRAAEVARLEEIASTRIERLGAVEVVQYRDEILPLIRVGTLLPERRRTPRGPEPEPGDGDSVQVVIYQRGADSVGLVVDGLVDIVQTPIALQRRAAREGVLGSMVVLGRVTEFLDVDAALAHGRALLRESGAEYAKELRP